MILSFIVQNLIHSFQNPKKQVFLVFFFQLTETWVFKFCPELETLVFARDVVVTQISRPILKLYQKI